MSTAFSREHRIKLSSFWEEKKLMKWPIIGRESRISFLHSLRWISLTRKLKLARPCFLCNFFKTLHAFGYLVISKNYVKIKLCLLIHGMYSFQSFVFDFV